MFSLCIPTMDRFDKFITPFNISNAEYCLNKKRTLREFTLFN